MAKPTISLMGATYSDVSGVELPKSGGGIALFPFVEGSETKTENGTYDVTTLAQLIVNVSGGGGLVYETGQFKPTSDIAEPTISFANAHTSRPILIGLAESSNASVFATDSILSWFFFSWYDAFGTSYLQKSGTNEYSRYCFFYKTSSGVSNGSTLYTNTTMARISNSQFKPYAASSSRYYRANHTYNWIAVWK